MNQSTEGFRATVLHGGAWTGASQLGRFGCQIASISVLARLLTPQDFGLVGVLASALAIIGLFRHIGLSTAIIQSRDISEAQLRRLFEITAILGLLLFVIVSGFGFVLAEFMEDPRVTRIAPWFGVAFCLSSLEAVPQGLLRREMKFRQLALRETASTLFGTAASIASALAGAGYWALIVGIVVTALSNTSLSWMAARWKPTAAAASWRDVLSFLRFGGAFTGSSMAAYFSQNIDSLLIGRILGYEQLGYYTRARALMIQPMNQFMAPVGTVLLPVFCRIQSDHTRFQATIATLSLPFLFLPSVLATWLMVGAPEIVHILLGDDWSSTTPIFTWLAASIIYMPFGSLLHLILVASGRNRLLLHWTWTGALVIIGGYVISVSYGTLWVAASFTLTGLLIRVPVALHFCHKTGLIATKRLAISYLTVLAFASGLYLLLDLSKKLLNLWTENPFIILAGTATPVALLLLLCIIFHPLGKSMTTSLKKHFLHS